MMSGGSYLWAAPKITLEMVVIKGPLAGNTKKDRATFIFIKDIKFYE